MRHSHRNENTGFTDVVIDPSNPDVLLAAAHQRRSPRVDHDHGGPESALYRSKDAGATCQVRGMPNEDSAGSD